MNKVRPMAIKFTDGEGVEWMLLVEQTRRGPPRDATPSDLLRSGYVLAPAISEELMALRALESLLRERMGEGLIKTWMQDATVLGALLKAIDEARK